MARKGKLTQDPPPRPTDAASGDVERANEFKLVTISLRHRDIDELEAYIERQKRLGVDVIDKSKVIRKALQLLFRQKKNFDQV